MRVYQVIDKSFIGGGQAVARNLAMGFRDAGIDSILSCRDGGPLVADIRAIGQPVFPIPLDKRFRPGPARALAETARRERVDIIHAHGLVACFYCMLARRLFGLRVPLLYHQHGFHHHNYGRLSRPLRRQAERMVCRHASHTIASSRPDRQQLIRDGYCRESRVSIVHYGIPEPTPSRQANLPPAALAEGARGTAIVGIVARLHPQKGIETFIRAAGEIRHRHPNTSFLIFGTGEIEPQLHRLIEQLALRDQVKIIGQPGRDFMHLFDVAVIASRWEGLPLVLLEYMSNGLPIVTTSVPGCLEAIDSRHAEIVPVDDPGALASAVVRLLQDKDHARRLARSAQQHFAAGFRLDLMVRRFLELYAELLQDSSSPDHE